MHFHVTSIYLFGLSHFFLLFLCLHFFRPLFATCYRTLIFYFLIVWLLYSFLEYVGIDFFCSFLLLLFFASNHAAEKLEAINLCLFFVRTVQIYEQFIDLSQVVLEFVVDGVRGLLLFRVQN